MAVNKQTRITELENEIVLLQKVVKGLSELLETQKEVNQSLHKQIEVSDRVVVELVSKVLHKSEVSNSE